MAGPDYRPPAQDSKKIQGVPVDDTPPTDGQALVFDEASGTYVPGTPDGGVPAEHPLGGDEHSESTLAELNALVSDATLDDAGDERPPSAHGLDEHGSATLAELNALVSDATLDDAGDSRDPNAHDLGGDEHSAATKAELISKLSDVTKIYTNGAGEIASTPNKNDPALTDLLLIEDSESSDEKKKVQVQNLPLCKIASASYTGNGTSQTVTLGWQPKHVTIVNGASGKMGVKSASMPGDDFSKDGGWDTDEGVTILSTGFSVGSEDIINKLDDPIYYTAWG